MRELRGHHTRFPRLPSSPSLSPTPPLRLLILTAFAAASHVTSHTSASLIIRTGTNNWLSTMIPWSLRIGTQRSPRQTTAVCEAACHLTVAPTAVAAARSGA